MILYDKDCRFLGASADILSILGYEDLNTFLSQNNDIADLFVSKQGYIYKFGNFSWINYVLNGSVPNKSVILKTRNGEELEANMSIMEISLSNGSNDKCFVVTINNQRRILSNTSDAEKNINNKQPLFQIREDNANSGVIEDFLSPTSTQQPVAHSIPAASAQAVQNSADDKVNFSFDKNDVAVAISHNQSNVAQVATPEIKINLMEIADILGINSDDVVAYMKEYVSYLDENVEQLQKLHQNGDTAGLKKIAVNLIGIGSNLRAKEIVEPLQKLLVIGAGVNHETTLQEIKSVAALFKRSVESL